MRFIAIGALALGYYVLNSKKPYMTGPFMGGNSLAVQKTATIGNQTIFIVEQVTADATYVKMVSSDGTCKFYIGSISEFDPAQWDSYQTVSAGMYVIEYK